MEYKVICKGNETAEGVLFEDIVEGDTIFVNGKPIIVTIDAHYSGDASYDGYLLYAGYDDEGYFPEDLDEWE